MRLELDTNETNALTACFEVGMDGLDEASAEALHAAIQGAAVEGDRTVIEILEAFERDFNGAFMVGWEGLDASDDADLFQAADAVAGRLGLKPSFTQMRRAVGRFRRSGPQPR